MIMMLLQRRVFLLVVASAWVATSAFRHIYPQPPIVSSSMLRPNSQRNVPSSATTTRLYSGTGIAINYAWQEEAFEIDVTVKVPATTRAKDIVFKAKPRSIDLQLLTTNVNAEHDDAEPRHRILLDANRQLRGRISLDGTYWVISEVLHSADDGAYREVTVTLEKLIRTPADDFEVVDYDWKGLYPDDADEVTYRQYDEPEPLDVREYARSLGVDPDNINMSMVDKTMYSSGLNLTQSSFEQLEKAGYMQEVTKQADGQEFIMNKEGNPEAFSPLGDTIGPDEWRQAAAATSNDKTTTTTTTASTATSPIPFVDTPSPWDKTTSSGAAVAATAPPNGVFFDAETNQTIYQQTRNFTRAAFAKDSARQAEKDDEEDEAAAPTIRNKKKDATAKDPIDVLTVKRMREILKSQGLKSSGNKKDLQERLRQQVNSLLQGKQDQA